MMAACIWLLRMDCSNRVPSAKKEGKEDFVYCILNPEPLIKGKITNLCTDGKTNLYFAVDREKVIHYDLVTKRTSVIREYDVVNRLFLRQGYLWICRLWNDIVCYDLKSHKERVVSLEGGRPAGFLQLVCYRYGDER